MSIESYKEAELFNQLLDIRSSAIIDASFDGFCISVSISTDFERVECACYLYSNDKLVLKSGYRNNDNHVFFPLEIADFKIRVFFRFKDHYKLKKAKTIKPSMPNNLKYILSKNIVEDSKFRFYEILKFSSESIKAYEKEGFKPRKDSNPYKLEVPINWSENIFNDGNWMFQLNAWRMLDPYFNRANKSDLNYISKIINDWALFEINNESTWLWYDMSTGLRALKLSYFLKKCEELNINHNILNLDLLIQKHLEHLSNPDELNHANHGLFQLHGLKGLCYILEEVGFIGAETEISRYNDYANKQLSKLLISQLGKIGVHTEHSPYYHFFAYKKIKNIVDSPWWADLETSIIKLMQFAQYAKTWLVLPNDYYVPLGDSAFEKCKEELPDLEEWPHKKNFKHLAAILDGYAVVRSDKTVHLNESAYLFFQGSFNSDVHKHCDDLSIILQQRGLDILVDSGKYGYKNDKYRQYIVKTRAHNTIEVDGQDIPKASKYAYGAAIKGEPKCINGYWVLLGRVNNKVSSYKHERILLYKPNQELYVVDIVLNTNQLAEYPRVINQWWHFDTSASVSTFKDKITVQFDDNKGSNFEITSNSSNGSVEPNLYKGYESNNCLQGWISKEYLKCEPTTAMSLQCELRESCTIITRFKFNIDLNGSPLVSLDQDGNFFIKDPDLFSYIQNEL